MTQNKKTVAQYMDGFNAGDHAMILDCLTDDVVWDMPGFFHHEGKEAFDKEIENDQFVGRPTIVTTRMIEENDMVVVEGSVKSKMRSGELLDAVFCDVFHMQHGKIKMLSTYLMSRK